MAATTATAEKRAGAVDVRSFVAGEWRDGVRTGADVNPAHPSEHVAQVAQTNDTPFGPTSSLFTRDLGRALTFAGDNRTGVVKINQESAGLEFQVPFGGMAV